MSASIDYGVLSDVLGLPLLIDPPQQGQEPDEVSHDVLLLVLGMESNQKPLYKIMANTRGYNKFMLLARGSNRKRSLQALGKTSGMLQKAWKMIHDT